MKKFTLIAMLLIVVILIVGCNHNAEVNKDIDESDTVTYSASNTENPNSKIITENESSTEGSTTETTSETATQKSVSSDTTIQRPADQKSAGQSTTKKVTTTQKSTTTQRQTTTKEATTTQKPTTTKKVTTTATTSKQKKLTKSDIDWVQSQAHSYIKSKGMSVNSSVGSFSYRTSSCNYTNRNELLSDIKETIDFEYSECMNSGWKKVDMYVSVSPDSDGDYWLVVMYG